MKHSILNRIKDLGGDISKVKGNSLQEDLLSITFDTVLYPKPQDTPWASAEDQEPIYELGTFIEENMDLYHSDQQAFFDKLFNIYYCLTDEAYGQDFWQPQMFTPFKENTESFDEWNMILQDCVNDDYLDEIIEQAKTPTPDFVSIIYSYGFPDQYYVCLQDPYPENPTIWGTDHEVFFEEITNEGTLEDLFNKYMTKDELIEIINNALAKNDDNN